MGCFLGPPDVCQLKAAVLSKSSTLTGVVVRPLENVLGPHGPRQVMYAFDLETGRAVSYQLLRSMKDVSLSLSGSNQARKGRLVNALAVRGDERRDTLR